MHDDPASAASPSPATMARLSSLIGLVLLVGIVIEIATIVFKQQLFSWHVFLGLMLIPVVAAKLVPVLRRFGGYYLRRPVWVAAGTPLAWLRWTAPVFVLATIVVLGSGVLLVTGHESQLVRQAHVVSFWIFLGGLGIHLLGHLREALRSGRDELSGRSRLGGRTWRLGFVLVALVAAVVFAFALPHHTPQRGPGGDGPGGDGAGRSQGG